MKKFSEQINERLKLNKDSKPIKPKNFIDIKSGDIFYIAINHNDFYYVSKNIVQEFVINKDNYRLIYKNCKSNLQFIADFDKKTLENEFKESPIVVDRVYGNFFITEKHITEKLFHDSIDKSIKKFQDDIIKIKNDPKAKDLDWQISEIESKIADLLERKKIFNID